MSKLVIDTKGAPTTNVLAILTTWSKLAGKVDKLVVLPSNCRVDWHVVLQNVGFRGHVLLGAVPGALKPEERVDCWEAYCTVQVTFSAQLGMDEGGERHSGRVPITEVSEIMINDDGTFFWHSEMKQPEDDPETVKKIAYALSHGQSADGHYHYRRNHMPSLLKPVE